MVLIHHLAVIDLAMAAVILLNLTALIWDRWVLGTFFCTLVSVASSTLVPVELGMVCLVNLSKLSMIMFPMRALLRSHTAGRAIVAVAWTLPTVSTSVALMKDGAVLGVYDENLYRCPGFGFADQYGRFILITFIVLPQFISTISMLLFAVHLLRRPSLRLNHQGLVLLISLSSVYMVSVFPFFLYRRLSLSPNIRMTRALSYFIYLGFTANPLIYYLTLASFRSHTNATFLTLLSQRDGLHNVIHARNANVIQEMIPLEHIAASDDFIMFSVGVPPPTGRFQRPRFIRSGRKRRVVALQSLPQIAERDESDGMSDKSDEGMEGEDEDNNCKSKQNSHCQPNEDKSEAEETKIKSDSDV